jgi:hypothetical protein
MLLVILLSLLHIPVLHAFKIKNNSGFKATISIMDHKSGKPLLGPIEICRNALVGFEPRGYIEEGLYDIRASIDDKKSLRLLANHIDLTKDTMFLIDLTKHERPVVFNCIKTRIKKCRRIPKHKKTGSVEIIPDSPFKKIGYQEVEYPAWKM